MSHYRNVLSCFSNDEKLDFHEQRRLGRKFPGNSRFSQLIITLIKPILVVVTKHLKLKFKWTTVPLLCQGAVRTLLQSQSCCILRETRCMLLSLMIVDSPLDVTLFSLAISILCFIRQFPLKHSYLPSRVLQQDNCFIAPLNSLSNTATLFTESTCKRVLHVDDSCSNFSILNSL